MDWDTQYDYDSSSIVSSRRWPDAADLAGALMAVPSLSDSLQASSPARKRKLFGSHGAMSPGKTVLKSSPTSTGQPGRQLAGLPSSKRARMSHSHPLARSSVSPPRHHQAHVAASSLLRQPSLRRSPSPVHAGVRLVATSSSSSSANLLSNSNSNNSTHNSTNGALSSDERTCLSCRRTATSLLQLAKFRKCTLCGGMSCPICSRVCQSAGEDLEEDLEDHRHERLSVSLGDANPSIGLEEDNNPSVHSHGFGCSKVVCRGCSVESPDGTVQCYRCHITPPT